MKVLICVFVCLLTCVSYSKDRQLVEISTSFGDIIVELNHQKAPNTVKNFLSYVDSGFYDQTIFHRVIDGFMIQGGGFEPGMKKKLPNRPIMNESNNGLSNTFGTIAMARMQDPHSARAQFFINVANNIYLNYRNAQNPGYCVFGRVIEGVGVIQKIKSVEVDSFKGYQNVPIDPVIIKRIRRVTKAQLKEKNISLPEKPQLIEPVETM